MAQRLKLYCDMDGVLVNFDKGYEAASGAKPNGGSDDEFWKPVLDTPDFWLNLEWMPGGRELWDYVRQHHYVVLLSSPGTHDKRAPEQKLRWVRRELGDDVNLILKQSEEKHHYACPNSILIDDFGVNIVQWRKAGGKAVHHRRDNPDRTIRELERFGLKYKYGIGPETREFYGKLRRGVS